MSALAGQAGNGVPIIPPHNIEAEQALIGALLIRNEALAMVSDHVQGDDFFEPIHRQLFEVVEALVGTGRIANPITVKSFLPANVDIAGLPLQTYIARLAASATTIINARDYARLIKDLADKRMLLMLADDITAAARDAPGPASDIAASAIEALDAVVAADTDPSTAPVTMEMAATQAADRLAAALRREGALGGMTTGLTRLDQMIDGYHLGEFTVLGARPSMGKTGVAVSSLRRTAAAGHDGIFFSLEMGSGPLADRVVSDIAFDMGSDTPSYWDLRRGTIDPRQNEVAISAIRTMNKIPLLIDPAPGLTVGQIVSRARRHAQLLERKNRKLKFVAVDHLHIVKPNERYRGNRTAEITEISSGLKALAKELNVAVIALAQLSRGVESREDRRPSMSDLRDSGSIEQDADTIMLLYREEYYLDRARGGDPAREGDRLARLVDVQNTIEIMVGKQRNGPIGTVRAFFDAPRNALRDLDWERQ